VSHAIQPADTPGGGFITGGRSPACGAPFRGFAGTRAFRIGYRSLRQSELESRLIEQQIPFYETSLNSSFPLEPIFQLKALLEDDRWSHIHVHGHRAALIARLACLLLRQSPPIIYTVHGYHPPIYPNPYSRLVVNATERVLSRWTNAYICVSESCRNDLLTTVPAPYPAVLLLKNAIPLPFLPQKNGRKNAGKSARPMRFLRMHLWWEP
jgi:glycosyltransferase involved in cell wall biosynthesis